MDTGVISSSSPLFMPQDSPERDFGGTNSTMTDSTNEALNVSNDDSPLPLPLESHDSYGLSSVGQNGYQGTVGTTLGRHGSPPQKRARLASEVRGSGAEARSQHAEESEIATEQGALGLTHTAEEAASEQMEVDAGAQQQSPHFADSPSPQGSEAAEQERQQHLPANTTVRLYDEGLSRVGYDATQDQDEEMDDFYDAQQQQQAPQFNFEPEPELEPEQQEVYQHEQPQFNFDPAPEHEPEQQEEYQHVPDDDSIESNPDGFYPELLRPPSPEIRSPPRSFQPFAPRAARVKKPEPPPLPFASSRSNNQPYYDEYKQNAPRRSDQVETPSQSAPERSPQPLLQFESDEQNQMELTEPENVGTPTKSAAAKGPQPQPQPQPQEEPEPEAQPKSQPTTTRRKRAVPRPAAKERHPFPSDKIRPLSLVRLALRRINVVEKQLRDDEKDARKLEERVIDLLRRATEIRKEAVQWNEDGQVMLMDKKKKVLSLLEMNEAEMIEVDGWQDLLRPLILRHPHHEVVRLSRIQLPEDVLGDDDDDEEDAELEEGEVEYEVEGRAEDELKSLRRGRGDVEVNEGEEEDAGSMDVQLGRSESGGAE
ncbi:hypothetical protein Q7P37_005919 [Cladosporium fusiforme]